jgi:hypothetical protein
LNNSLSHKLLQSWIAVVLNFVEGLLVESTVDSIIVENDEYNRQIVSVLQHNISKIKLTIIKICRQINQPVGSLDFHSSEAKRRVTLNTNNSLTGLVVTTIKRRSNRESASHAHGSERSSVESAESIKMELN